MCGRSGFLAAPETAYPGFPRHDHVRGDTDEKSVPSESGPRFQQASGVGDGAELAVENDVALVGAIEAAIARPRCDRRAAAFQEARLRASAEVKHLPRQLPVRAEPGRQLARTHDDDLAAAGLRHDLLTQQRAAAFNQVPRRVHLGGTIDGEIDLARDVAVSMGMPSALAAAVMARDVTMAKILLRSPLRSWQRPGG